MIGKADFVQMNQKIYSVVSHREESTRELSSQLLGSLFMIEAFQAILSHSYGIDASNAFPSVRTMFKDLESLQSERPSVDSECLQVWVNEETKQLMKEMKVVSKGVAGGLANSKLLEKMNSAITTILKLCVEEMKSIARDAPPTPQIAAKSAALLQAGHFSTGSGGSGSAPNSARGLAARPISGKLSRAASFKSTGTSSTGTTTVASDVSSRNEEDLEGNVMNKENMRMLKSRSGSARSMRAGRPSPRPSAAMEETKGQQGSDAVTKLSGKWYEIKLLLKTIPTNEDQWHHAVKVSTYILVFVAQHFISTISLSLLIGCKVCT
jgi:hypothetical protein